MHHIIPSAKLRCHITNLFNHAEVSHKFRNYDDKIHQRSRFGQNQSSTKWPKRQISSSGPLIRVWKKNLNLNAHNWCLRRYSTWLFISAAAISTVVQSSKGCPFQPQHLKLIRGTCETAVAAGLAFRGSDKAQPRLNIPIGKTRYLCQLNIVSPQPLWGGRTYFLPGIFMVSSSKTSSTGEASRESESY